jgi:ankyrin repeat protein
MVKRHATALCLTASTVILVACAAKPQDITPLAARARTGDVDGIRRLAAAGANLDANDPGSNHWTPLLHAIHKGRRDAVEALIRAGADVNKKSHGLSPLEMAAANGQLDTVQRLLAAGANPREPGVFAAAVSGGALSDLEKPLLGRCNTQVVSALLERAPDLRLPRNARGHLSWAFARLNHCRDVLGMVRWRS